MTAPATRTVRRGNGHSHYLDGVKVDGVTTLLDGGIPKPALVGWAANTTAQYAVDRWDDLAQMGPTGRYETLKRARFDSLNAAGARGTAVHDLAHRLASGEEVDVPEALTGHVDAYLSFVRDWAPVELLTETTVVNRAIPYMGVLDVIAQLADGNVWLLDWKTGKGIYPETALQLAAYRYAETFLDAAGEEQPMPAVDRCGAVWLRADGYDLVPLNAGPATFRTFRFAAQVARFTSADRSDYVSDALPAPGRRTA